MLEAVNMPLVMVKFPVTFRGTFISHAASTIENNSVKGEWQAANFKS